MPLLVALRHELLHVMLEPFDLVELARVSQTNRQLAACVRSLVSAWRVVGDAERVPDAERCEPEASDFDDDDMSGDDGPCFMKNTWQLCGKTVVDADTHYFGVFIRMGKLASVVMHPCLDLPILIYEKCMAVLHLDGRLRQLLHIKAGRGSRAKLGWCVRMATAQLRFCLYVQHRVRVDPVVVASRTLRHSLVDA